MGAFLHEQLYTAIDRQMPVYQEHWKNVQPKNIPLAIRETLHSYGAITQELQHNVLYSEALTEAPILLFVLPIMQQSDAPLLPLRLTLTALEACQRQTGKQPLALKWLILIDKEHLLTEIIQAHQERLQADHCLWHINSHIEESTNIFFLGCKGKLRVELIAQTASHHRPAADGTFRPNALWRLIWALGSLKSNQEEVLIANFYDTIEPPEEMMLASLYTLPDSREQEPFLLNLHGFQLHYARLLTPTCTVTIVEGGEPSMLPDRARAEIEFHLVPGQQPEHILKCLEQHLNERGFSDIQIHHLESFIASRTTPHSAIVQALRNAALPEPLILPLSTGSYPAAILDPKMPVVFTNLEEQAESATVVESVKRIATMMLELTP